MLDDLTDRRYIGKICEAHPNLGGLRLKSNTRCIQCVRDRKIRYRDTPAGKAATASRNSRPEVKAQIYHHNRCRRQLKISAKAAKDYGEFDALLMAESYDLAKRRTQVLGTKWVVDHVVPLIGVNVCGLHVGANLSVIPEEVNRLKSNKF